jgi:hypothetical protein
MLSPDFFGSYLAAGCTFLRALAEKPVQSRQRFELAGLPNGRFKLLAISGLL